MWGRYLGEGALCQSHTDNCEISPIVMGASLGEPTHLSLVFVLSGNFEVYPRTNDRTS